MFELDFNIASSALQRIEPTKKISYSTQHNPSTEDRTKWTLDDYRKKDPKALQRDNELYNKLLEQENK